MLTKEIFALIFLISQLSLALCAIDGYGDDGTLEEVTIPPPIETKPPATQPPATKPPATIAPPAAVPTTEPPTTKPPPPVVQGCAADFFFLLDSSGSVRDDFQREITIIEGVVDKLTIAPGAHRAASVGYSSAQRKQVLFNFEDYTTNAALKTAIAKLRHYGGTTGTATAMTFSLETLDQRRKDLPCYVIVLTDGYTYEAKDLESAASAVRALPNVELFVVAVNDYYNEDGLIAIAGQQDRVVISQDVNEVIKLMDSRLFECKSSGGFRGRAN